MKFIAKLALLLAACTSVSVAATDLYFKKAEGNNKACFHFAWDTKCIQDDGTESTAKFQPNHELRMRFIAPPMSTTGKFGFYLDRPFFIIDGIHLSTTEARTLDAFQKEADEFGMTQLLKALGYTPVFVQFSETVRQTLQNNSRSFADALKYLNNSESIPFPNKNKDGFIVMGISQGGIIGRYGSYLYSTEKDDADTPIKFYASLDSPHQGAILPRGLIANLHFWSAVGVPSAQAFYDLIRNPGAEELVIYETGLGNHLPSFATSRFLFKDYRKAAEYKGFPAVLISQGQLKGHDPEHKNNYYELNRSGSILGVTVGSAQSSISYSTKLRGIYSHARQYKFNDKTFIGNEEGETPYDFVQGSTYPFAKTLYESLREGIYNALPDDMKYPLWNDGSMVTINTKWESDKLNQESSTFIPTVSAMDLKCDGKLAITTDCIHTQSATGFPFENPGALSTGNSTYAVDPSHPRYNEPISGRHIESPIKDDTVNTTVLSGMQTDIWRILCELAKYDYDPKTKTFDNPGLNGYFSPSTQCMDATKIPDFIKNTGMNQQKDFGYIRYDFSGEATEANSYVGFILPAGWQKVATIDNGGQIPPGTIFEIDIMVKNSNANWMKAELLLTKNKQGSSQLQLSEQDVPLDGNFHTIRWTVPASMEAVRNYRWFRLVLNSEGGAIISSKPKLITSAISVENTPKPIESSAIYPNTNFPIVPWSSNVSIQENGSGDNSSLQIKIPTKNDGFHINLTSHYSLDKYKELKVSFEPGTCQNTMVYFDSKNPNGRNLVRSTLQNGIAYKILPLSEIVDTEVTPNHALSASRLVLQAISDNESCTIRSITLQ